RGGEGGRRRPSGRQRGRALESKRLQQNLPGGKNDVAGDGGEIVEELAAGGEFLPSAMPDSLGAVADGVDREGQEIQGREHGGEVLFSVAEIVLDIITLGFENVEGLVFDLPVGAPAGGAF